MDSCSQHQQQNQENGPTLHTALKTSLFSSKSRKTTLTVTVAHLWVRSMLCFNHGCIFLKQFDAHVHLPLLIWSVYFEYMVKKIKIYNSLITYEIPFYFTAPSTPTSGGSSEDSSPANIPSGHQALFFQIRCSHTSRDTRETLYQAHQSPKITSRVAE